MRAVGAPSVGGGHGRRDSDTAARTEGDDSRAAAGCRATARRPPQLIDSPTMTNSMNLTVSGLPALIVQVGFIVVFSAPVWLAARVVGAANPTLLRAIGALILGAFGSAFSIAVGGGLALLLAPLSFLLAFKWVLGTSFLGSIALALVALFGYWAMLHFIGAQFGAPVAVPSHTTVI
jgi:hypothetical protein